jgi:hypothetical protein
VPISKRAYFLLSLLGLAALAWIHWIHSWPMLARGHTFIDLGDSPGANPLHEVFQSLALLFLFGLYAYCLSNWDRLLLKTREVVGLLIAQSFAAWLALPANSTDVFGYIALGRIAGLYGSNPYVHTYSEFADFYYAYVEWDITMPYGPVLLPVFMLGGWIAQHSVLAAVFALKVIWLVVHGVNCRLVYLLLNGWNRAPAFGLFLFGLNPLVLLEQMANGHNDGVMVMFGLLGILALQRGTVRRAANPSLLTPSGLQSGPRQIASLPDKFSSSRLWPSVALVLALLSALVKLPGLFFYLVVVVYLARKREWRALVRGLTVSAVLLAALKLTLFPTKAALLSLTNAGNYAKNSIHSIFTIYGVKLNNWLDGPFDYDMLYTTDRRIFSVLFFVFCLWRVSKIVELTDVVRELACLFLALLTVYATWFFPWYVAWLIPLAALTESARLRWAIVTFSCTALVLYAFPHSMLEPPTAHWLVFPLRIAVVHLIPLGVLAGFTSRGEHGSKPPFI